MQVPVKFNEVPEKVPKVLKKVWEASVQSQVTFNRVPEKVQEKVGEALVQSRVKFNRVPEKVPVKVWEASVQSQVRFNRAPEKTEGLGGSLRCRARSGSTAFQRRFRRRCGRPQPGSGRRRFQRR